jgi:hypothetical protein
MRRSFRVDQERGRRISPELSLTPQVGTSAVGSEIGLRSKPVAGS